MPRLFHRPPKYRFHKTTNQAVVSYFGKQVFLGPYGSPKSHKRYQEVLTKWRTERHRGPATLDGGDKEPKELEMHGR